MKEIQKCNNFYAVSINTDKKEDSNKNILPFVQTKRYESELDTLMNFSNEITLKKNGNKNCDCDIDQIYELFQNESKCIDISNVVEKAIQNAENKYKDEKNISKNDKKENQNQGNGNINGENNKKNNKNKGKYEGFNLKGYQIIIIIGFIVVFGIGLIKIF